MEWTNPPKKSGLWSPHFKGGSQTTGPRARGNGVQGDWGMMWDCGTGVGRPWPVPSKGGSGCGQDVGSPLPPGLGPSLWAGCTDATTPPARRKMWEPRAAASPLPQPQC